MRVGAIAATLVAAGGLTAVTHAGTATSNVAVSASVASVCSFMAGPLGVGAYDTLSGANVDATVTVTLACTKGAVASVTLGQDQTAGSRSMDTLPIYDRAAGANVLSGATVPTRRAYILASSASSQVSVYGRITTKQESPVGSFSDAVVATILF